jgi:uncharacterized membrane protein
MFTYWSTLKDEPARKKLLIDTLLPKSTLPKTDILLPNVSLENTLMTLPMLAVLRSERADPKLTKLSTLKLDLMFIFPKMLM